ncbi:hypothetical protein JJQ72_11115 [Paenibacillus sp. F411]|uniref:hypothetical protein n=1 Tax=Paenibacillus sp. F411 TaxID=2820239 RepID=UPI001AB01C8F|nr:hypothetical protein [Paenibacillus sp. F411]MBO2944518.1 hypothetical protein [Paenibacillus sp. F411]
MINEQMKILNQIKIAQGEWLRAHTEEARAHAEVERLLQLFMASKDLNHQPEPTSDKQNLNAELFLGVTDVYFAEEGERLRLGNARKSGRRVNVEITNMLSDFFNRHLGEGYTADRETDGSVYVWKDGRPISAIRFITDMGFIRGEAWYEIADGLVSKVRHGLKKHQIFFIVGSLRNGLDLGQVESYLGKKVVSGWQFMHDREAVKEYVAKVQARTTCLADPEKQLIFLATGAHPNVLADDMYKLPADLRDEKRVEVRNYEWIHNIDTLIDQIKLLGDCTNVGL